MVSKRFRVLKRVGDKNYVFCPAALRNCISEYRHSRREQGFNEKTEDVVGELSDAALVSMDAIRNWMYGKNGPSDMDAVQAIADCMKIDSMRLLIEEEPKIMEKTTNNMQDVVNYEKTKDVIRVVYQKMCRFLDNAVENRCYDGEMIECMEDYNEGCAEFGAMYSELVSTLHCSMLDIPQSIYRQLEEIITDGIIGFCHHGMSEYRYMPQWETSYYRNWCTEHTQDSEDFITPYLFLEDRRKQFYEDMRVVLRDYLVL